MAAGSTQPLTEMSTRILSEFHENETFRFFPKQLMDEEKTGASCKTTTRVIQIIVIDRCWYFFFFWVWSGTEFVIIYYLGQYWPIVVVPDNVGL
jgi:hypothetical protein